MQIREHARDGVHVENLTEISVQSMDDTLELLRTGMTKLLLLIKY
jgi:hypothetical protein